MPPTIVIWQPHHRSKSNGFIGSWTATSEIMNQNKPLLFIAWLSQKANTTGYIIFHRINKWIRDYALTQLLWETTFFLFLVFLFICFPMDIPCNAKTSMFVHVFYILVLLCLYNRFPTANVYKHNYFIGTPSENFMTNYIFINNISGYFFPILWPALDIVNLWSF
jgi:hypothetical protein